MKRDVVIMTVFLVSFWLGFSRSQEIKNQDVVEKIATSTQHTIIVEKPQDEAPVGLEGVASYYDYVLDSGWSSVGHFVCATRDFDRGSCIEATNVANNQSVYCKVTDYGPDASVFPERVIDLSSTAFSAISDTRLGIANVVVRYTENINCER